MSSLPPPLPDPAPLIARIRAIPDWPKPGVVFRDITPLLLDPQAFRLLVECFVIRYMKARIDRVAGIDARGFIIGSVVAHQLNAGFIPIRKAGKLPWTTLRERYTLEYGESEIEIHTDAIEPNDRVLLIDDLIATGGTMLAAARLLSRLGATVVETAAIIDLPALGGSARLREAGFAVHTLCAF